ncbi:hypothetical protein ACUN9V_19835 [Salinicola sp. V024]|uniref:hypothetical protein n=1 Tax=Salinicola sp. V024 TaxID=3459609 RepID=UPI0040447E91
MFKKLLIAAVVITLPPPLLADYDSEKKLAREAKQFTVAALRGPDHIELQEIEQGNTSGSRHGS